MINITYCQIFATFSDSFSAIYIIAIILAQNYLSSFIFMIDSFDFMEENSIEMLELIFIK
jgi:hypothetical protein